MPIINVEIVARADEKFESALASVIANNAGVVFGSEPGETWVKVAFISKENYAENDLDTDDINPVFVSVLKLKLPSPEMMKDEAEKLTSAIAQACGRPRENVHIVYLPEGAGRTAFGGKIVPG